jgi:hypothetical protein
MSEIKALVLRRTVSRIADLVSGALTLANFQWGFAKDDGLLVARDDVGGFHFFPDLSYLNQAVIDATFARAPVATYSALRNQEV